MATTSPSSVAPPPSLASQKKAGSGSSLSRISTASGGGSSLSASATSGGGSANDGRGSGPSSSAASTLRQAATLSPPPQTSAHGTPDKRLATSGARTTPPRSTQHAAVASAGGSASKQRDKHDGGAPKERIQLAAAAAAAAAPPSSSAVAAAVPPSAINGAKGVAASSSSNHPIPSVYADLRQRTIELASGRLAGVGMCGAALMLDRYVVLTGGIDSATNVPVAGIDVFDLESQVFLEHTAESLRNLPLPLYGHCSTCTNTSTVWCIGGATSGGQAVRSIISFRCKLLARAGGRPMDLEIFDFAATAIDASVLLATMPLLETPSRSPLACIIGGITQDDEGVVTPAMTNRVLAIDLDEVVVHRVHQVGDAPPPHAAAAAVTAHTTDAQRVVLFGGRASDGSALGDVFVGELRPDPLLGAPTLHWRRYSQRSKADVWPAPRWGHSICRFGAQLYLITGCAPRSTAAPFASSSGAAATVTGSPALSGDSPASVDGATTLSAFAAHLLSFDPETGCSWTAAEFPHASTARAFHSSFYYVSSGGAIAGGSFAALSTPPVFDLGGEGSSATTSLSNARGMGSESSSSIGTSSAASAHPDIALASLFLFGGGRSIVAPPAMAAESGSVSSTTPPSSPVPPKLPFIGIARNVGGVASTTRSRVVAAVAAAAAVNIASAGIDRNDGGSKSAAGGGATGDGSLPQPSSSGAVSAAAAGLTAPAVPIEVVFRLSIRLGGSGSNWTPFTTEDDEEVALKSSELTVAILRRRVLRRLDDLRVPYESPDDVLLDYKTLRGEMRPMHMDFLLREAVAIYGTSPVPTVVSIDRPPRHFTMVAQLGRGSFGTVYTALDQTRGSMFAIKIVGGITDENKLLAIKNEVRMMRQLSHPNIVRYLGSEIDGDEVLIFMEYIAGVGTLEDMCRQLRSNNTLMPMRQVQMYTRQILHALEYLHSFHVVHRDIKGCNAILAADGTVKLADFGTATYLSSTRSQAHGIQGTYLFLAPECIDSTRGKLSTSADIWSVGCLVVQLVTCDYPYRERKFEVEAQILFWITSGNAPQTPARMPPAGRDFLARCFDLDPTRRATARELLEHPFIRELVSEEDFGDAAAASAAAAGGGAAAAAAGLSPHKQHGVSPVVSRQARHYGGASAAAGGGGGAGGGASALGGAVRVRPQPVRPSPAAAAADTLQTEPSLSVAAGAAAAAPAGSTAAAISAHLRSSQMHQSQRTHTPPQSSASGRPDKLRGSRRGISDTQQSQNR